MVPVQTTAALWPDEARRFLGALGYEGFQYLSAHGGLNPSEAKQQDLQNRLGFVVSLGRGLAESKARHHAAAILRKWEHKLESSRLMKLDPLSIGTF